MWVNGAPPPDDERVPRDPPSSSASAWLGSTPLRELRAYAASQGKARRDFRRLKNFRREPEDVVAHTESRAFWHAGREGELSVRLGGLPAGSREPGARAPVFLGPLRKFWALIWEITSLFKVRSSITVYCLQSVSHTVPSKAPPTCRVSPGASSQTSS